MRLNKESNIHFFCFYFRTSPPETSEEEPYPHLCEACPEEVSVDTHPPLALKISFCSGIFSDQIKSSE